MAQKEKNRRRKRRRRETYFIQLFPIDLKKKRETIRLSGCMEKTILQNSEEGETKRERRNTITKIV